jgi:hypothetical protein
VALDRSRSALCWTRPRTELGSPSATRHETSNTIGLAIYAGKMTTFVNNEHGNDRSKGPVFKHPHDEWTMVIPRRMPHHFSKLGFGVHSAGSRRSLGCGFGNRSRHRITAHLVSHVLIASLCSCPCTFRVAGWLWTLCACLLAGLLACLLALWLVC